MKGHRGQKPKQKYLHFILAFILSFIFLCVSGGDAARTGHASKKTSVKVTGIKYWSNPNYTRVVINVSGEAVFTHRLLKEDPNINKPRRFYVDIKNASLSPSLKQPTAIDDVFVKTARAGQYTKDTVRVVLDIKSIEDHKIFSLAEPFRIVVDIMGKPGVKSPSESYKPTLAQQLGLKIKRIVIDAGHGGKDPGAIGKNGLREKDVVLKIVKGLKESLAKETGVEIIMTRDDDRFIELEERTAIANTKEADIFISVHANASFNRKARGVETYFLNLTNDARAIRVAARENAVSTKKMSDLQYILNDLMKTAKTNESSRLAAAVQGSLVSNLKTKYSDIKGNGVKGAPFYVLVGTHMPSILVEVSFISNPTEEKRLADNGYIQEIVAGITSGVNRYVKEMEGGVE
ncbi:MAG: N-acetylmuramoyl-L-alanine amidase [Deltaproteobacteria bacterium]|nr:N-acetylmuramoyl-L-alanine amidase [Deltaproteobacteria bacterium]